MNNIKDELTEFVFIIFIGLFILVSFYCYAETKSILLPAVAIFVCYATVMGVVIYKSVDVSVNNSVEESVNNSVDNTVTYSVNYSADKIHVNGTDYRNVALAFGLLSIVPAIAMFFTSGGVTKIKERFTNLE
jgi:hypothetical protein